MTPRGERIVLGALLLLFVSRAVIAERVVPPWQGPDEPTHFVLSYFLTQPPELHRRTIETQVLDAMARHRWWELYGREKKYPVPRFDGVEGLGSGTLEQPLYYGVAAATLITTRAADLESAYSRLRVVSVGLSLLALAFGWAGARVLLGPDTALGVTAAASLHPQFLLTAISVNADALLNVWGALAWWQAARLFSGGPQAFSLVLMVVAAVAAVLTKRLGVILLVIAGITAVVWLLITGERRITRRELRLALFGAVTALVVGAAGLLAFDREFARLPMIWRQALTLRRPLQEATTGETVTALRSMIDYWWLTAGWLRFPAPDGWFWAARGLTIVGLGGAALAVIQSPALRRQLWIPWLFVVPHVVTVFSVVLWTVQTAPQGRYLFPVIIPTIALIYVGLMYVVPRSVRPYWPVVLLAGLLAMDLLGFTTVIIPAYTP